MARAEDGATLLAYLAGDAARRLTPEGTTFRAGRFRIPAAKARQMLADGLLVETPTGLAASEAAKAWLSRRTGGDAAFRRQHGELGGAGAIQEAGAGAMLDRDESPVATLARRTDKDGAPLLAPHAVAGAERLRRDFEIAGLQPRVTSNWSASIASGRRGDRGGAADLTDMALGARRRFEAAMRSVGPELSGILIDVCCFLKGLETVERERRWPARSAKLVLRIALDALARHYGLMATASGRAGSDGVRHWGAEDYRPEIT